MLAAQVCTVVSTASTPAFPVQQWEPGPLIRGMISGMGYGIAAAVISHPFDTIKVHRQSAAMMDRTGSRLQRLLGLYRGIGPATGASILFRTIPFIGYEATRSALSSRQLLEGTPLLAAFLGGAVGGVLRGCVETPSEFIKTRMQICGAWPASQLLRGLSSTCLRNSCVIGLFWVAFEATAGLRSVLPPLAAHFVGGGGCSVIAWAAIYPLDTAKSNIQAGGGSTSVIKLYQTKGVINGWYAGLGAGLTRAFLANGGGMVVYALVQEMFARWTKDGLIKAEL